jgi:hypothetical protein
MFTRHTWKPKTLQNQKPGLRCRLKWSQKCPSTKSKTCLGIIQDTQPSPTKIFVPNVNGLDFVGEMFGGSKYVKINLF